MPLPPAKHVPPPDGMNDADYKNFKNVPGAGWAWLFLRRNPEFRRRCAELANYDDLERRTQERLIARDFGLRRFKHCDERYGAPGERRPLFNPMARWRSPESKDEVLQHTAIVRKGQVLLRFDVRPSLIDEKSLMVQLASALKILEMERKKLHEAEADSSLKTTSRGIRAKGDHRRRIIWLRILDAHNNNIDPMEALAKIAPIDYGTPDSRLPHERQQAHRDLLATAQDYAERRYLAMALEYAPRLKKFVVQKTVRTRASRTSITRSAGEDGKKL